MQQKDLIKKIEIKYILYLQIAWDAARKLVQWRFDREKGRNDAAQDISDLSEGEREKGESNQTGSVTDISRISSDTQLWSDDKSRKLYIVLIR